MNDVTAIGELLIDFTPNGLTPEGTVLFGQNPGGAPANVLAFLAKLGKKTTLICKVGNDQFGKFLFNVVKDASINTEGIVFTEEAGTTLAFVHLFENGDREFSFYRKPGADMLLRTSEIQPHLLKDTRVFHFGSVSLTKEPAREATLYAVSQAKKNGAVISYDPNLRLPLWDSLDKARTYITEGLKYADILKMSREELEFISGTADLEKGSARLRDQYGIAVMAVTLGAEGAFYRINDFTGLLPAYDVATIDTTGAGDAFWGAFLYQFIELDKGADKITADEAVFMTDFANAAGSLSTSKKGAIPSLPSLEEILLCMSAGKRRL